MGVPSTWPRLSRAGLSLLSLLFKARTQTFHHHSVPRRYASSTRPVHQTDKLVYVSSSTNIFENLALEEWLYENLDLSKTDCLLMWRNAPAVVIGRHQNPWLECDVQEAVKRNICVARRSSGGGTVYHDEGNLNFSFLMHRSRYDRRCNLSQVVEAVTSSCDLDLNLNCRDDLILNGIYKVSGTASKLSGSRTYHHFTLMLDVNTDMLTSVLHSPLLGVDSRATKSVPSPVKNLREEAPDMTFDLLVGVIGQHFSKGTAKGERVDPTDQVQFPGISSIRRRLESWDWVFGKTPRFSVTRTFVQANHNCDSPYQDFSLRVSLVVDKGHLLDISVALTGRLKESGADVSLPFGLLEVVDIAGERLERGRVGEVWERGRGRLGGREGEGDEGLLRWGLECVAKCVPVG